MAASGSTPNLGLPIYQNSDTPKFIPDFNSAMNAIDGGYKENKDAIAQTNTSLGQTNQNVTSIESTANQALQVANTATGTASSANQTAENASSTANNALNTANQAKTSVDNVSSKLTDISDLTATGTNDWKLQQDCFVKNGILMVSIVGKSATASNLQLSFNYNISQSYSGVAIDKSDVIYFLQQYINEGTMVMQIADTKAIMITMTCPWDSSWTKIS